MNDVYENAGLNNIQTVVLNYTDMQTGGKLDADGQIEICEVPAGGAIDLAFVTVLTDLAGATDIVANIGYDAADPDELIDALDLDGLTKTAINTGTSFNDGTTDNTVNLVVNNTATAKSVVLDIGGTVGDLTAGKIIAGVRVLDLAALAG